MPTLPFTVDSALLKELGERLIGKPHVALAELVKNSYDADANEVLINFDPEGNAIEVMDDGHGMNFEEFKKFWMRIGTPYKSEKLVSRGLKRPRTGSKGVGRLSVQFLADSLRIQTVSAGRSGEWLEASVDWRQAVRAGELTKAKVEYSRKRASPPFRKGTCITLQGLKNDWSTESLVDLAKEVWWLQPPFQASAPVDEKSRFTISFVSPRPDFEATFVGQLKAIMEIWIARLVGRCEMGKVNLSLEFAGEPTMSHEYRVADFPHNEERYQPRPQDGTRASDCNLNSCSFEIRVFKLSHRQPHGIKVGDAREYLSQYGGVHVYDAGFHLPYYGQPTNDWLQIEYDHAHRRTLSPLLPESLQITRGLNQLPTVGRLFGVVNVNTSREPGLEIQITRDRLADTRAYRDLQCVARYALDFYAMEEARRKVEEALRKKPTEPSTEKFRRVEVVLEEYEPEIPKPVYEDLRSHLLEATAAAKDEEDAVLSEIGILGPLATAGIAAVAYQHELRKQFAFLEQIISRLRKIKSGDETLQKSLLRMADDLEGWLERSRATNALFDPLSDPANAQQRQRLRVGPVVAEVIRQTRFLARGIDVDNLDVSKDMRLPEGSFVEWSAVFQNVFINAFNAMLDSDRRLLKIVTRQKGRARAILVQDTGKGVNLASADDLFKPFVRKLRISRGRQSLGYGGTGLGLTIVKLIADNVGCEVAFVEPESGYKTAFSIAWKEQK
jgi:signal transduction histidine kinase